MKSDSKGKLYFNLFVNIFFLIIGIYLSEKLNNKWLTLTSVVIIYLFATYSILNFKNRFPQKRKNRNTPPIIVLTILIGIIGLYFVNAWILPISFSLIINNGFIDILIFDPSLYRVITALIIFPFLEEILFRRIILQKIYNNYGFYPAIWISSIFFSLSHINTDSGLLGVFISGLILGYIYLKTKNIWLTIFSHSLNNLLIFVLTPQIKEIILEISQFWIFFIITTISFGFIFIMINYLKKYYEHT